jgi:integrase
MASIARDPGGYCRLLFAPPNSRRKVIRLGRVSERDAATVLGHVEQLIAAAKNNTMVPPKTLDWLAGARGELARKLAAAGLIARRHTGITTLAEYFQGYRDHRSDVSKGTNAGYRGAAQRLLDFFRGTQPLHAVTEGDADRWVVWLKSRGYAGPTVSKSIKVARQFWAQAIRDGLATTNPFAHLRTPSEVNTARAYFVDRETFNAVLAACPDHEWRTLLALARYGGLRTPSEPLSLQWGDVNWERKRYRVVSPKTKHHDGGERWVPLFPELLPIIEEAFDRATPGATHVITRWRDTEKNLRTGLLRILRKASIKPWPRLYQNLRATRETELCERFPIHVVAEWLGNSPKTALAHYTQVTEDHYRKAAQETAQPSIAGTRPASPQRGDDGHRIGDECQQGEPGRELATVGDSVGVGSDANQYPRQDSNL